MITDPEPTIIDICKSLIYKLNNNWDDGLPARIDRRDIHYKLILEYLEREKGK